jgi:hypothetical protein
MSSDSELELSFGRSAKRKSTILKFFIFHRHSLGRGTVSVCGPDLTEKTRITLIQLLNNNSNTHWYVHVMSFVLMQ